MVQRWLLTCESAWGPGADRHNKPLTSLIRAGSFHCANSQSHVPAQRSNRARRGRSAGSPTRFLNLNRDQPRPSCGHVAPFVGSWLQVLKHSSTSLRSQAMQPPPPSLWPTSEGRDWRGRDDGGNNAHPDTFRAHLPIADRTFRSRGTDHNDGCSPWSLLPRGNVTFCKL